jgi:hypothetical protein
MPGTTGFRLDAEQRERVQDCLGKAGASLIEPFEKFIGRIESSIDHFRSRRCGWRRKSMRAHAG